MRLPKKSAKWLALGLLVLAACNNEKTQDTSTSSNTPTLPAPAPASDVPVSMPFDVVNQYPHDVNAFTEGLEYKDGVLYEGTGQYGYSDLRKVDLKTGKVLQSVKMEPRYFGEGITILNGKIYQLTYREGKGFVYDLNTLKQERSFTFKTEEGWGMTNNGTHLIFDDGTNTLHFVDPATMTEVKTLKVTDEHGPVNEINEPEMIKGYIYANQWMTDLILKIDTGTGKVVGRADLSSLHERYNIPEASGRRGQPDVLNGIAYDAAGNRVFVTGKNWPILLEVKLDQ